MTMAFTEIEFATWPRRDHFRLFQGMDFPYFSVTLEVDITAWLAAVQAQGQPFFPSFVHAVTTVANGLEAFRLRIRGERIILHDRIHPSVTVPWRGDLFNFCTIDFDPDPATFLARYQAAAAAATAAEHLLLDEPGRDDMIFLTSAPWFAFTGLTHPVHSQGADSFPRVAWGRRFERDGRVLLPLNFQLHHGLADGYHVARFLEALEARLATEAQPLSEPRPSGSRLAHG